MIPRSKMADIYAEMLMTDQWILSTPGMRMIADTSMVYEPILEKYGYDKLDYIHSVDYYMNDPERFSRILRTSAQILEKRLKHLHKLQKLQELEAEAAKKALKFQTNYSFEEYFPYMGDEPYVHYYDSLTFEPDSLLIYRLVAIETSDTLYDGLEMIIKVDSLAVCDSVPALDSLVTDISDKPAPAVEDTIVLKKARPEIDSRVPARMVLDSASKKKIKNKITWQERE